MPISKEKYKQAILYICKSLGKEVRGKKKLAKLLYYLDFDFFEKTQHYFIGEKYKALPMGPFPEKLEAVVAEMVKEKKLAVQPVTEHEGYVPTEVYRSLAEPNIAVFSDEEKKMLNRVLHKYGQLNGKQLEDLAHAEAPYIGTKATEEISYELAFYRGTDFRDGA